MYSVVGLSSSKITISALLTSRPKWTACSSFILESEYLYSLINLSKYSCLTASSGAKTISFFLIKHSTINCSFPLTSLVLILEIRRYFSSSLKIVKPKISCLILSIYPTPFITFNYYFITNMKSACRYKVLLLLEYDKTNIAN